MKILLTGTTGYIGKRLLPYLLRNGHEVVCCVRDKSRFDSTRYYGPSFEVIEVDFLDQASLSKILKDIDIAYYLIHSMSATTDDFETLEAESATNFVEALSKTNVKQVIFLSGIVNDQALSKHLSSRFQVEQILSRGKFALTTLRAGIIVGSGSASFEIIRDLVEKLPVMVTPKWLNTKSQPIGIRNMLQFLLGVIDRKDVFNKSFDIGGPEVLTYKEMLLIFAKARHLKRWILTLPVMTPKLSSYWLFFVTSTSYKLAINLVNSMKVEVICKPNTLAEDLNIQLFTYEEAVNQAFARINQKDVMSSWTDAQSTKKLNKGIRQLIEVPTFGCFVDKKRKQTQNETESLNRIWAIGGKTGWYYANALWTIRGYLDKLVGGVGLRRGRKNPTKISAGDTLDFWRVIYADKREKRLLLYAEMRLPGEAWLEFKIEKHHVIQTATFRPRGVLGRLYWYSVVPFHGLIFNGMIKKIAGIS